MSHQNYVDEAGNKSKRSRSFPAGVYQETPVCHKAGGHEVEEGPEDAADRDQEDGGTETDTHLYTVSTMCKG